jgi:PAS domain S-box-containing protein
VKSAADVPARPQYRKISPLQISLLFAAAGCLWILLSDRVLALFFEDPGTLTRFQTYKGWLFVITLASGLYVYLRRELARQAEQGSELDNVMRALDREKSRFEAIIAAMGEGISIQDRNYRVLYQNQVHRGLVGGGHVGEMCYRAYQRREQVCPGCHLARAYLDGKVHRAEQSRTNKDGVLHYEIVASPLLDPSGEVIAGIEMVRDITARKQLEALNRDILEAIDEAFIVIDRDYRVLSVNRAYSEQVKMPPGEIIGRHCYQVSHNISRPCYEVGEECTVRQTYASGLPHTAVHTHRDSAGSFVYVETKSFPMKDPSGAIVSVIETINNITAKRNLEEQLRHALKMEAVGTLTGGIAHDFNNILTAILGYASILKKNAREGKASPEIIELLLAASTRASGLTKSLLTFSRKQTMEPRPFDLNETVRSAEKLLTQVIGEDVGLVTELDAAGIMVLGDHGQIEQVLMNLVSNARDAMPDGGTLKISTAVRRLDAEEARLCSLDVSGDYATLTVSDTGGGMDEKTRKKIFDPFFTTKEAGKGTGLGLSIVYGIVKQHRGSVAVTSAPGKGTSFDVFLPAISSASGGRQVSAREEQAPGSGTILLAEDSPEVRNLARDILVSAGYSVIEAVDGEDALGKFAASSDRVHLLVLDVIMPRKDGKAVYAEIRRMNPHIKVLFISGYTADRLEQKGLTGTGVDGLLLQKPFVPSELLRKVETLLGAPAND